MIFILSFHIVVAISGLIFSGLGLIAPSKFKLQAAYWLVAATMATGFYLVLAKPAHMAQTCIEGLAYLAVAGFGIFMARRKLAAIRT